MGQVEELSKEETKWLRIKQELEQKRKALDPTVANVDYGEKMEPVIDIEERLANVEKVDREIEEAEAKLNEIRKKRSNLPR